MIKAVMTVDRQRELVRKVFSVLSCRAENVSNFMEADSIFGPDSHLVYKHFATLYFVFVFDSSENELAMLDLIQVFVETLDKCFKNVCELDVVFNYEKMQTIIDEMIFGGQVLEVNSAEIMRAVEEISKLEAASNALSLVPKSLSWLLRAVISHHEKNEEEDVAMFFRPSTVCSLNADDLFPDVDDSLPYETTQEEEEESADQGKTEAEALWCIERSQVRFHN
ncbi:hypothetical protein MLD38_007755 [Melastoma candidum]|uniref:Uncharacterized protein n=1 Tax=Melastoma candidum TaxID=119954 RepID=A0ACB9RRQ8_9MYRT|nr:hypothetical protein MLD38_007755 [Melastoma candidum]